MNIDDQSNVAWIIKHRPQTVKSVVGEEAETIQKFIDSGNVPHFLFESRTPGTGKTTLAKAMINDLGADYLELNSSMDRGIDTIRDKIIQFVQTMSSKPGIKKVVFCDEFDGMTKVAQDSMRNLMEKYATNVTFILTCNYIEKVIEPIKNRCEVLKFGSPQQEDIKAYLESICLGEEVKYTGDGLDKLIDIHYPSIRNMVGELQRFRTLNLEVNEKTVKRIDEKFEIFWEDMKKGSAVRVREDIIKQGIEPDLLVQFFFDKTFTDKTLTIKQTVKITKVLAELDFKLKNHGDKKINIASGIFDIYFGMVAK